MVTWQANEQKSANTSYATCSVPQPSKIFPHIIIESFPIWLLWDRSSLYATIDYPIANCICNLYPHVFGNEEYLQNKGPIGITAATLYRNAIVETDLAIHIQWEIDEAEPSKSDLGIELAAALEGFSMHAKAARDEMKDLAYEFQEITSKTSVDTPNLDMLRNYII